MPVAVELDGLCPASGRGAERPGADRIHLAWAHPGGEHQVPGSSARRACRPDRSGSAGRDGPRGRLGAAPLSRLARRDAEPRAGSGSLGPSRAAEVGRSGRGPRRPRHPRGARGPLGTGVGLGEIGFRPGPGRRRRRDRREPAGRRIGGHRSRGGPVHGGAIGRGRAVRGAVGRPVGGGPGHRRNTRSRPGGRSGRAVIAGFGAPSPH